MEIMDHERILIAKHYLERALKIIEDGPDHDNGGWSQYLWAVNQSTQRAFDMTDVSDDG